MNIQKRIYNGPQGKTAVILAGYCPETFDNYKKLFRIAKKSFKLQDSDITCGHIVKSDSVQSYTMILFRIERFPDEPMIELDGKPESYGDWIVYNRDLDFKY